MGMSLNYLLSSQILKKLFKGQCGYCGKYGHKAVDCHERKANLENKKERQGKFKPNQNRKPIQKQGTKTERIHLTSQRLSASSVTNMDILLEIAQTQSSDKYE